MEVAMMVTARHRVRMGMLQPRSVRGLRWRVKAAQWRARHSGGAATPTRPDRREARGVSIAEPAASTRTLLLSRGQATSRVQRESTSPIRFADLRRGLLHPGATRPRSYSSYGEQRDRRSHARAVASETRAPTGSRYAFPIPMLRRRSRSRTSRSRLVMPQST
jgi:hypothetical protein